MEGYRSQEYAAALSELGAPRHLPGSGGWLLERAIAGTPHYDAAGPYPIFACADWSRLADDLEDLAAGPVSLTLVADPFGAYDEASLRACFPDLMRPYKEHFVIDLALPPHAATASHHARNARKALSQLEVALLDEPASHAAEWAALYANLARRHGIGGPANFSASSLAAQLAVPGTTVFRASRAGETVGMLIWYVQAEVGYYHLAAYSDAGYELRASFALFWRAIEHFAGRLRWLSLGAGAGVHASGDDGLTRFKRGWASGTRTAYLCGRICDPERYAALARGRSAAGDDFFPIYRKGEFR